MTKPAKPPHDTKLGMSGISLTMARVPNTTFKASDMVKIELEEALDASGYFDDAPFSWITLIFRYGLKNEEIPHYQKINKKYGDLPLSIEVNVHEMIDASLEDLRIIFRNAAIKALIHAGERYGRPVDDLRVLAQQ